MEEHWVGDRNANAPKMGIKIIGLFLRKKLYKTIEGENDHCGSQSIYVSSPNPLRKHLFLNPAKELKSTLQDYFVENGDKFSP